MEQSSATSAMPKPPIRRRRAFPWRSLRRAAQLLLLGLFLWLFRRTEYAGADELAQPVNFFFRIDPLISAAAVLAGRTIISTLWPALVIVGLTILLGRFFCGWVCPLGTLLDLFHRLLRPIQRLARRITGRPVRPGTPWANAIRPTRHVLLILMLIFAAIGLPLVGYLDPIGLLTRGLTFGVDPAWHQSASRLIETGEAHAGWWTGTLNKIAPFVRDRLLPFQHKAFGLASVAMWMLAAVFALELLGRRFWCRYLCPLGSMVGVLAWFSPLRRVPERTCTKCANASDCGTECRMGAFDASGSFSPEACNLCMDCQADCNTGIARFTFRRRPKRRGIALPVTDSSQALGPGTAGAMSRPIGPVKSNASGMSRRAVLTSVAAGLAVPAVVKAARLGGTKSVQATLLRPPGAGDEKHFLNLCIRCGECLKVCPTNGLQPAAFEAGVEGLFSPRLVPRTGYCELNCTLCGQVCPTHAIPALPVEEKVTTAIGLAIIDREKCLPWAKNEECICCEEHCPVSDKAIVYKEVRVTDATGNSITLQRPSVVADRCIGCGICENKCPLDGESAIRIVRLDSAQAKEPEGEHRRGGGGGGRGMGMGRGRGRQ